MTVCVFANIQISNSVRFGAFKKSFLSLSNVDFDKWYINIRGSLKEKAEAFLRSHLGAKLVLFDLNSRNWHRDSRIMFASVNEKAIFYWIEDHILQIEPMVLSKISLDFIKNSCDYMSYSFWGFGSHVREFSGVTARVSCEYFDIIDYGKSENEIRQKTAAEIYGTKAYIVGLCGLFSYEFFHSNLFNKRILPLRRWPKATPFDFERSPADLWILPFRIAVPKLEISCSLDDDNQVAGSSLVSRALENIEISRNELLQMEGRGQSKRKIKLFFKRIPMYNSLLQPIVRLIKRLSFYF